MTVTATTATFDQAWRDSDLRAQWDLEFRLRTLALNLATGAALDRAFRLGHEHGYAHCPCDRYLDDDDYAALEESYWSPGCKRSAP